VDPTTGTVRAKARFPNGAGNLFPNQFVNVRVTLETLHNAVVVPLTAVRTGPNGDFVWVVKPGQTVTMRPVKRGQTTPTQVVILSGLAPCERVVTDGGDRLTEGAHILLPGQAPQGGRGGRGGRYGGQGGGQRQFGAAGGQRGGTATLPTAPGCPGAAAHAGPAAPQGAPQGAAAPAAAPEAASQPQAEGGAPGGGFQPTPEMQAARAALRQACAADLQKLCAGQEGREAFMCLRQNAGQASAACQAAMAKMPHRGGAGGPG
jgi:multidrug efflux system membrane fusion protein